MLKKILVVSAMIVMLAVLVVPFVAEAGGPNGRGRHSSHGDGICDNSGANFVDENGDGICDNDGLNFVDEDGDGVCDNYHANFVDEDGDGISDNMGTGIQRKLGARWSARW